MKRISKDLMNEMVLDVFSQLSRLPTTNKEFAEESMKIMDNPVDNSIFSGVLLLKAVPRLIEKHEDEFANSIASALRTFIWSANDDSYLIESGFNKEFLEKIQKGNMDSRLEFSLMQMIQAWNEYGRLEKQYPNVMQLVK
jgi:hypothetical protein